MLLTLFGVLVVVIGFAVRLNPLLVVTASAFVTGLAAGMSPVEVLAAFGKAFNDSRLVSASLLALPLVGTLERAGLQTRSRTVIARLKGLSLGPLMIGYLALRQITAASGLLAVMNHAQTVRPVLAPMAEEAAERDGPLPDESRQKVRAMCAATENIGAFFSEDIFLAFGSVLLIVGFLGASGIVVEPLKVSVWAIPTALVAFAVQGARLMLFQRRISKR